MQGVNDADSIAALPPAQIDVLLTFAPPARSYVVDQHALSKLRKSTLALIKAMSNSASEDQRNQASSLLTTLPYTTR